MTNQPYDILAHYDDAPTNPAPVTDADREFYTKYGMTRAEYTAWGDQHTKQITPLEPVEAPPKKPRAQHRRLAPHLADQVLVDFSMGDTPTEIAARYNTTPGAVRNRLRRAGMLDKTCPHCGGKL